MILVWFIAILLVGGIVCWVMARWSAPACRWIALAATVADFVLSLVLWIRNYPVNLLPQQEWLEQVNWTWLPDAGIHFHLAIDGLSLLLVVLTFFLGIVSVLASWKEISEGVGFFHLNLLWVLAGITGVLLASEFKAGVSNRATGYEFDALVVTLLGGVSISGGFGSVLGMFVGAVILSVVTSAATGLLLPPDMQFILKAVVTSLAIVAQRFALDRRKA